MFFLGKPSQIISGNKTKIGENVKLWESAETTLLGVVTAEMAVGVLGVRPAQPAMTVESRRHPISGTTVVVTPVQSHAVDLVADNPGSAGTKRRRLADALRRQLRHRMLYRHACPLGPGTGSRRSSGATAAAGGGTACHHLWEFVESFSMAIVAHV